VLCVYDCADWVVITKSKSCSESSQSEWVSICPTSFDAHFTVLPYMFVAVVYLKGFLQEMVNFGLIFLPLIHFYAQQQLLL